MNPAPFAGSPGGVAAFCDAASHRLNPGNGPVSCDNPHDLCIAWFHRFFAWIRHCDAPYACNAI